MRFSNPAPARSGPTVLSVAASLVSGKMTAVLGTPPAGVGWYVNRVSLNLSVPTSAYLYVGTAGVNGNIVDGSAAGQLDTADYVVPLYVPPLNPLTVVWQSATGTGSARVEYVPRAVS